MYHYFPFVSTGDFSGDYSHYSSTSFLIPSGYIGEPSDILKFNSGTNAWSQIKVSHIFLNSELTISSLNGTNWTTDAKLEWFNDFLFFVGLSEKITPSEHATILNYFESRDLFQLLSSPSVAYVTRNDGTNGAILDPYLSDEVSIGLNVYDFQWLMDLAKTMPNNAPLKNKIYSFAKKGNIYISNACMVDYRGFKNIVYCFDGIVFPKYNISSIGLVPSLSNGGGNIFGEVRLAASTVQAHYIVKKNVSEDDPTVGLVSGEGAPFCIGDFITIVDTSAVTSYNSTTGWTWLGDFSQINYVWDIADVSKLENYSNVPIHDILFPLRIIQFMIFDDFG